MKVAVLGAGAWGTALAIVLAKRHRVALWARSHDQAAAMSSARINSRYLPGVAISPEVSVTAGFEEAVRDAGIALIATPTGGLREMLVRIKALDRLPIVVWACKGFESGSARLSHQIVSDELGAGAACGALSGPSFALEVAQDRPAAVTFACNREDLARETARTLHQNTLRVYYTTDVTGVEIGGAVKNVMAIAAGISDGLSLGLNARAALITRGLAEMTRLGTKLRGRPETFMGLAGAGDLILTCTGDLSRNRHVGMLLASGMSLEQALQNVGHVAEGVHSAREVRRIATEKGIDMPITKAVCEVLFEGLSARLAVQQLLTRDPREEAY